MERGITGIVKSNEVGIWYEGLSDVDNPKETIVLIEGLAATSLTWFDYFVQPLLDQEYRVIRFDNRDVGHSTWFEDAEYDLSDMAKMF